MPELDLQDSGLDGVQAAVEAFHLMEIFLALTVVAQHADLFRARSGSFVVTAPPSPHAPRFLPG
jgi:hypothetical protein